MYRAPLSTSSLLLMVSMMVVTTSGAGCGEIIFRSHGPEPEHTALAAAHPVVGTNPTPMMTPVLTNGGAEAHDAEIVIPPLDGPLPYEASRIQVFASKHIDALTEVVGVLDMHTSANSEDKGFDLLRMRALALGADAVIGAEFEHGEGNEPSHLSGMAVRYVR